MSVRKSRSARFFTSQIESLEKRMLLTTFANIPISFNSDFVGSTASVGPDGYKDIGLNLSGIPNVTISSIRITANTSVGDLNWAYGNNTNGLPYAEFVRSVYNSTTGVPYPSTVDLSNFTDATIYISPLKTATFNNFTVYLEGKYAANGSLYSEPVNYPMPTNSNYLALDPFTRAAVSNIPLSGGNATFDTNQVTPANSTTTVFSGDIHISATLPSGYVYGNMTSVSLSDSTNSLTGPGNANNLLTGSTIWSDNTSFNAYSLIRQASSNSSTTFDLYAPPIRNEAGACMTLTMVLNNGTGPKTYFTQFSGQTVDVTKYNKTNNLTWYNNNTTAWNLLPSTSNLNNVTYSNGTQNASLASLLTNETLGTDHFYLNAGNYYIDANQPLVFSRPLWLDGSPNANIIFNANSLITGNSLTQCGSLVQINSNHVMLSNINLSFSNPVHFSNGTAISINKGKTSPGQRIVDVTLSNLTITGPASTADDWANQTNLTNIMPAGRNAQNLIMADNASGFIVHNTFKGGPVEVKSGPWNITDNTFLGTTPTNQVFPANYARGDLANHTVPSYSDYVFRLDSAHDVNLSNNTATVQAPSGNEPRAMVYRFLLINNPDTAAYNINVANNVIGSGMGRRFEDDSTRGGTPNLSNLSGNPYNQPEMILNENYQVNYEGVNLQHTGDAHVLALPSPSSSRRGRPITAGDVVAILSGTYAGQYRTVAQVLDQANANTTLLLLTDTMPGGANSTYEISVSRGLVNTTYANNTIDLSGTTSTGIVATGNQFGLSIINNTITGNNTEVIDGNGAIQINKAIRLEAQTNERSVADIKYGYQYQYPLPTMAWTRTPLFNVNVANNTINNTLGGISVWVDNSGGDHASSSLNRRYFDGTIACNTFTGYSSNTTNSGVRPIDTTSLIRVGGYTSKMMNNAEQFSYQYALLDANGSSALNSNASYYYSPGLANTSFADVKQINLKLGVNFFVPANLISPYTKQAVVVSGIINGTATNMTSSLSNTSLTISSGGNFIVDDGDTNFANTSNWTNYSGPSIGGYLHDHTVTNISGNASLATAEANWTFNNLEPGQYEVWASWVQDGSRAKDAPYSIYDGSTLRASVRVNQTLSPDVNEYQSDMLNYGNIGWHKLTGSLDIVGTSIVVKLTNNATTGTYVVADGVRIRKMGSGVMDNTSVNFNTTGYSSDLTANWVSYPTTTGYLGGHAVTKASGNSTNETRSANWTFNNLTPGDYEVWATWVPTSNRATDAPFTVYDGTTSRGTVRVNEQQAADTTNTGVSEWYGGQPFRRLGGRFAINSNQLMVKLGNNAGTSTSNEVVADAVWVRRVASTIVDDRDVNFSVTPLTGNPSTGWALYGGTSTPGYLNSHYAANSTGSAGNITACATWNFPNILPGYYEIWATWRQGPDRSGNAPFTIYDGSTSVGTMKVNEINDPNDGTSNSESFGGVYWKKITTTSINSQQLQVILQNNTSEASHPYVIADGIRIKRIANYLIDDAEPNFTTTNLTDSWSYYGSTSEKGYANDHEALPKPPTSSNATGYATWNFTNLPNGSFRVYASWREADNRATNAQYRVNSSACVTLDQTKPANSTSLVNLDRRGGDESNTGFQEVGSYSITSGNLTVTLDNYGANNMVVADSIYIKYLSPLMASNQMLGNMTQGELLNNLVPQAIIDGAIERWQAAGISDQKLTLLKNTQVDALDLPAGYLGFDNAGGVEISRTGDGRGWFIDPTPNEDSEFRFGLMVNPKGFDLLTVLEHEFGHILGFDDLPNASYPADLMADTILPGVRKNAADSIYSPTPIGSRLFDPLASVSSSLALVPTANPGLTATAPLRARPGIFSTPMVMNPTPERLSTMTVFAPQANRDASLFLDASKLGARKFYPKRATSRRPL